VAQSVFAFAAATMAPKWQVKAKSALPQPKAGYHFAGESEAAWSDQGRETSGTHHLCAMA